MKRKITRGIICTIFILLSTTGFSQLLYSNIVETGNRFNPGLNLLGNSKIAFDDVQIPSTLLSNSDSIFITKLKVGIRRIAGAGATDVKIYYTILDDTSTNLNSFIKIPPILLGNYSLSPTSTSFTQILSLGDSINPIIKLKTDTGRINSGFHTFYIGVSFSNPDANNGIRITNTASVANDDIIWIYDADSSVVRYSTNFSGNPKASFYVQVFGYNYKSMSLPICVKKFDAICDNGGVILNWKLLIDGNCQAISLERSLNNTENFQTIYSSQNVFFCSDFQSSFYDKIKFSKIFYRLVQLSKDGVKSYSKVLSVSCNNRAAYEIKDFSWISGYLRFSAINNLERMSSIKLNLFTSDGRLIESKKVDLLSGLNNVYLKIANTNVAFYTLIGEDFSIIKSGVVCNRNIL